MTDKVIMRNEPARFGERPTVPSMPLRAFKITPSDTAVFTAPVTLKCVVAGDVSVIPYYGDENGEETNVPDPQTMAVGDVLEFCVRQVLAGTTATVIGLV